MPDKEELERGWINSEVEHFLDAIRAVEGEETILVSKSGLQEFIRFCVEEKLKMDNAIERINEDITNLLTRR
jgi:hypothetical protein